MALNAFYIKVVPNLSNFFPMVGECFFNNINRKSKFSIMNEYHIEKPFENFVKIDEFETARCRKISEDRELFSLLFLPIKNKFKLIILNTFFLSHMVFGIQDWWFIYTSRHSRWLLTLLEISAHRFTKNIVKMCVKKVAP